MRIGERAQRVAEMLCRVTGAQAENIGRGLKKVFDGERFIRLIKQLRAARIMNLNNAIRPIIRAQIGYRRRPIRFDAPGTRRAIDVQ